MIRRVVAWAALVTAVGLAGCASDDWEGQYRDAQSEILDMASERDLARERHADAMADLEAERALNAQAQRELAAQEASKQEAIRRAQEIDAEYQRLLAEREKQGEPTVANDAQLDRLIRAGYDGFRTPEGDIGIRLSSDVTFGSGKVALTKSGISTLRRIGPELTSGEFSRYLVRVEGHTDNVPLDKTKPLYGDNRGLGSARANSVTQYLERELGISPSRIESVSKGEFEPIADNSTKEGRAKNRRVEIILVLPRDVADRAAAK